MPSHDTDTDTTATATTSNIQGYFTTSGLARATVALGKAGYFIYPWRFAVSSISSGTFDKYRIKGKPWTANTAYSQSEVVVTSSQDVDGRFYYYEVSNAVGGTSGTDAAVFNNGPESVTDNDITWNKKGVTSGGTNVSWHDAKLSSVEYDTPTRLTLVLTIPIGASSTATNIEEVYIYAYDKMTFDAKDTLTDAEKRKNEFLLVIAKAEPSISYHPKGRTTLRLILELTSVVPAKFLFFRDFLSTDITQHNKNPVAHPDIRKLLRPADNLIPNGDFSIVPYSPIAVGVNSGVPTKYAPIQFKVERSSGQVSPPNSEFSRTTSAEIGNIRTAAVITPNVTTDFVVKTFVQIPARIAQALNKGIGSFSFWIYQNTGKTLYPTFEFRTPTSKDEWDITSLVNLGTSPTLVTQSFPTLKEVATQVKIENIRFDTTSSTLSRGLLVVVKIDTASVTGTIDTNSVIQFTEFKLERSAKATAFSHTNYIVDQLSTTPLIQGSFYDIVVGSEDQVDSKLATHEAKDIFGSGKNNSEKRICFLAGEHQLSHTEHTDHEFEKCVLDFRPGAVLALSQGSGTSFDAVFKGSNNLIRGLRTLDTGLAPTYTKFTFRDDSINNHISGFVPIDRFVIPPSSGNTVVSAGVSSDKGIFNDVEAKNKLAARGLLSFERKEIDITTPYTIGDRSSQKDLFLVVKGVSRISFISSNPPTANAHRILFIKNESGSSFELDPFGTSVKLNGQFANYTVDAGASLMLSCNEAGDDWTTIPFGGERSIDFDDLDVKNLFAQESLRLNAVQLIGNDSRDYTIENQIVIASKRTTAFDMRLPSLADFSTTGRFLIIKNGATDGSHSITLRPSSDDVIGTTTNQFTLRPGRSVILAGTKNTTPRNWDVFEFGGGGGGTGTSADERDFEFKALKDSDGSQAIVASTTKPGGKTRIHIVDGVDISSTYLAPNSFLGWTNNPNDSNYATAFANEQYGRIENAHLPTSGSLTTKFVGITFDTFLSTFIDDNGNHIEQNNFYGGTDTSAGDNITSSNELGRYRRGSFENVPVRYFESDRFLTSQGIVNSFSSVGTIQGETKGAFIVGGLKYISFSQLSLRLRDSAGRLLPLSGSSVPQVLTVVGYSSWDSVIYRVGLNFRYFYVQIYPYDENDWFSGQYKVQYFDYRASTGQSSLVLDKWSFRTTFGGTFPSRIRVKIGVVGVESKYYFYDLTGTTSKSLRFTSTLDTGLDLTSDGNNVVLDVSYTEHDVITLDKEYSVNNTGQLFNAYPKLTDVVVGEQAPTGDAVMGKDAIVSAIKHYAPVTPGVPPTQKYPRLYGTVGTAFESNAYATGVRSNASSNPRIDIVYQLPITTILNTYSVWPTYGSDTIGIYKKGYFQVFSYSPTSGAIGSENWSFSVQYSTYAAEDGGFQAQTPVPTSVLGSIFPLLDSGGSPSHISFYAISTEVHQTALTPEIRFLPRTAVRSSVSGIDQMVIPVEIIFKSDSGDDFKVKTQIPTGNYYALSVDVTTKPSDPESGDIYTDWNGVIYIWARSGLNKTIFRWTRLG